MYICMYVRMYKVMLRNINGFQHVVFWRAGFLMATRVLFATRTALDFQINGQASDDCRARAAATCEAK